MTFREQAYNLQNEDFEYYEYSRAIAILESSYISEGFLSKLSSGIKSKIDFFTEVAKTIGKDVSDLLVLFKDSRFFKIFKAIGFAINKIVSLFKLGVKTYNNIQNILAEKIASLGGVKFIKKNLHLLDEFFTNHPILKKLGGLAIAGLLFYIWTQMSFTPDLEYSMDFKDIILALSGSFSLAELFASPSGITMLIYLASGMLLGLSTPWPGKQATQIVGGLLFSAYRLLKIKGIKLEMPKK